MNIEGLRKIAGRFTPESTRRKFSPRQSSILGADIDAVWRNDKRVPDRHFLESLSEAAPHAAAAAIIARLEGSPDALTIREKINALGVLDGTLSSDVGVSVRGGVFGIFRSDTPMILITEEPPKRRHDRSSEIVRQIAKLVYGQDISEEGLQGFIVQLRDYFFEIEGELDREASRAIGSRAFFSRQLEAFRRQD